jgi:glucose-6-phosphate 1-dehydrogenase
MSTPDTGLRPVEADACVVFGATGDLSLRMLFPSLYHLEAERRLNPALRILGVARQGLTRDAFLGRLEKALRRRVGAGTFSDATWSQLAARIDYRAADITDPASAKSLLEPLKDATAPLFYLATSPALYGPICSALGALGLATEDSRVVLEKPLGRDLVTSRQINRAVAEVFSEERTFRIDHYLGKETVQNLLALRFANALFEPMWNSLAIDHVQITVAETEGVGERWPYYDEYGAARDMLQNHMLQLLALIAMEPPSDMSPAAVRNEKVKVIRSLRRISGEGVITSTVRGQYTPGAVEGEAAAGYEQERGQPSGTETFVALHAAIDNWRWAGTPFFLRTGKRLPHRKTQIVIQFKAVPHSIFASVSPTGLVANRLVIDLQPKEHIELLLMNKAPGLDADGMDLQPLPLSLSLANAFGGEGARRRIAYERLLLDAIRGSGALFVGREEIEEAWAWVDTIAEGWAEADMRPQPYAAGTWGPAEANALIASTGRRWDD